MGLLSFSFRPAHGFKKQNPRRLEIGSIVMTRGRAGGGFRNDPAASLAVNRPPAWRRFTCREGSARTKEGSV
jgi:hypothetical protein